MFKNIKQTILNGFLILIPLTLLLIILLKLYGILIKIATPLGGFIPLHKVGGITIANLIVVVLVLILCYAIGLIAKKQWVKNSIKGIENGVLIKIPGYVIIQGFINDLKATKKASDNFKPVLVRFDDQQQICFEIERMKNGLVVIFVPGAPNPWSGSVVYVEEARVSKLNTTVSSVSKNIQQLGLHSEEVLLYDKA